jgi:hypothetical protein
MQRGNRKSAEHHRIPSGDPSICSQRVILGEAHVQVGIQPIGLADKYRGTDKLLPEYEHHAAHQHAKDDGSG